MTDLDVQEKRSLAIFIFIFILFGSGIATASYFTYRNYEKQFRAQVENQLSAVTDLKVSGLENWRAERTADAESIYNNPAFAVLVQRSLENSGDTQAEDQLQTWLDTIRNSYRYDRVFLLDSGGIERVSSPVIPEPVDERLILEAAAIIKTGQVTFLDFHRDDPPADTIYLTLLVPVYKEQDRSHPLGVLVLRIDPYVYLYPFIQQWPVPSQSAETLLVRRDGEDALYLNELKFEENTALTLRIPLKETQILSVQAVLGQTGIVHGLDYRGAEVIGDVRAVPDSPWFLVTRIDTAEVYAPLRERLWQTILFFGTLVLLTGAGLMLVWRRQCVLFYRGQVEAAEALRESEAYIKIVLDNLPVGIAVNSVDPAVSFNYMNDNFLKFYRTTKEKLADPDGFWSGVYEESDFREKIKKRVLDDLASGNLERMLWVDIPITRKGEATTFVTARNIPIPNKPLMVSTVWDVTERKHTENELAERHATLSAILESAATPVFSLDCDYRYTSFNSAHAAMMKTLYGTEIKIGQSMDYQYLFEDRETARKNLDRALSGEQIIESAYSDETGRTRRYFEIAHNPIRETDGKIIGVSVFVRDITERKQIEESLQEYNARLETEVEQRTRELREAQEQLVRQERLAVLGQLAGSIGHELRNPLGVISNAVYFLKISQPNASDKVKEYLDIIEAETRTSDKIVTDLLDFTRIKSLDRQPVSISELIHQTLEHHPVPQSINVVVEVPTDLPHIYADPHHIIQVLANLVSNACQSMIPAQLRQPVTDTLNFGKLIISATAQNDMIKIAVRDMGAGIPPENMKKIFEPLFTTRAKGIGLGLAVSCKLAEANGGRIEAESEAGKGSTFTMYLPVYKES